MATTQQEMEADARKLFIGGISWDTNEDSLLKYFMEYGEVEEIIIIRDQATGHTRGFGFIVFADLAVAKHVIKEKHMIDGRMVEVKKAIPRDGLRDIKKSDGSARGSRGPNHTKKIFIGGLASTVTKVELTKYFKRFGTITDVVVVYDHNTQRSRGFGFVTYDSEDAVDRALFKTFHKVNGKKVDVKRANPKELSPRPRICSLIDDFNHVTAIANSFLNGYNQGYNLSPLHGYKTWMDECCWALGGHNGFPSFGGGCGIGRNFDPRMNPWIGGGSNFNSSIQYGWHLNPYYSGNPSRFNNFVSSGGVSDNNGLVFDSLAHNLLGNLGHNQSSNFASSNFSMPIGDGDLSGIESINVNWGNPHHVPTQGSGNCSIYETRIFGCRSTETNLGQGSSIYGMNVGSNGVNNFNQSTDGYAKNFEDLPTSGGSIYGDTIWRSRSFEHDGTSPFGHGLQNYPTDVTIKSSTSYMGN